jgi:hypothetical protein
MVAENIVQLRSRYVVVNDQFGNIFYTKIVLIRKILQLGEANIPNEADGGHSDE